MLLFGFTIFNVNAQVQSTNSFLELLNNSNYQDTGRVWLQGNVGESYFKSYALISNDFRPSFQYDIKLMFKFIKNPKLINGAIGVQFSENTFSLKDQYAIISEDGIALTPLNFDELIYNRIRMRSINMPVMLHLRARNVNFLKKFKFGVGVVPGFNFSNGLQKTNYTLADRAYVLKEKSDFDMTTIRGSFLFEIFFNNLSLYYEHGINAPGGSQNFTTGINKLGFGIAL